MLGTQFVSNLVAGGLLGRVFRQESSVRELLTLNEKEKMELASSVSQTEKRQKQLQDALENQTGFITRTYRVAGTGRKGIPEQTFSLTVPHSRVDLLKQLSEFEKVETILPEKLEPFTEIGIQKDFILNKFFRRDRPKLVNTEYVYSDDESARVLKEELEAKGRLLRFNRSKQVGNVRKISFLTDALETFQRNINIMSKVSLGTNIVLGAGNYITYATMYNPNQNNVFS